MNKDKLKSLIIISLISFGHFWHDIFTAFITPLMPVIKESFKLNYLQIGWILVAVKLPSILSANIASYSEKHNPKWFVIICPLLTSVFVTTLGIAPNFITLFILVLFAGLSASAFHIPAPTLLKSSAPKKIGLAMTAFQIGGEAARTLGPLIVVLILSTIGFKNMYYLIPISLIITICFYLIFKKVGYNVVKKDNIKGSVLKCLKEGKYLFVVVAGISIQKSLVSTIMRSFLPLYLIESGESLLFANGSLAIIQGAAVAGVIVAGIFLDKVGAKRVLVVVISSIILLVLLFVFITNIPIVPILILIGFFSFSSMPAIYTMIQNHSFSFPTTANGLFMSLNFGISSLILLLGGKLSDIITLDKTYRLFSLFTLVGLPVLYLLIKRVKIK